jgi:hypothetical protein
VRAVKAITEDSHNAGNKRIARLLNKRVLDEGLSVPEALIAITEPETIKKVSTLTAPML